MTIECSQSVHSIVSERAFSAISSGKMHFSFYIEIHPNAFATELIKMIAKLETQVIVTIVNYFISKFLVFKSQKK